MERKINDVINDIKGLTSMKDYKPERFAVENGDAHIVANDLKRTKITQLRKFFTEIKRIEKKLKKLNEGSTIPADIKNEIYYLNIELAYARGRNLITQGFYNLMKVCLNTSKLVIVSDFKIFVKFLEAIIAYYKISP